MPTPIDPSLQLKLQKEEKRKAGKPVAVLDAEKVQQPSFIQGVRQGQIDSILREVYADREAKKREERKAQQAQRINRSIQAAKRKGDPSTTSNFFDELNKGRLKTPAKKIEEEGEWDTEGFEEEDVEGSGNEAEEAIENGSDDQSVNLSNASSVFEFEKEPWDPLEDFGQQEAEEANEATQEIQAEDDKRSIVTDLQSEKIFQEAAAGLMEKEEAPPRPAKKKGKAKTIYIKNAKEFDALFQQEPEKSDSKLHLLSDLATYNELLEQQEEQKLPSEEIISEESEEYKEQINKRQAQIEKELEDLLSEMQFWAKTQYREMQKQHGDLQEKGRFSKTALKVEKERVKLRYSILSDIRNEYKYLSEANIQEVISIARKLFSSKLFYKNNQQWTEEAIKCLNNLEDSSSFIKTTDKKFLDLLEELYNTYYFIDDKGIPRQLEYPTLTYKEARAAISRRRKKIKENIQITREVEALKEEHVSQFDAQNNLTQEAAGEDSSQEPITFEGIQSQSIQEQQVFEAQEEVYDKTLPNDASEGNSQEPITFESTPSQLPQAQSVISVKAGSVEEESIQTEYKPAEYDASKEIDGLLDEEASAFKGVNRVIRVMQQDVKHHMQDHLLAGEFAGKKPFKKRRSTKAKNSEESASQKNDNIVGRSTNDILNDPAEVQRLLIKGKYKKGSSDYNYGYSGEEDAPLKKRERHRRKHHQTHSISQGEGDRNSQGGDWFSISDKASRRSREDREIPQASSGFAKTLKEGMNKFFSTQNGSSTEPSSSSEKLDREEKKQSASEVNELEKPSRRRRHRRNRHIQPNHAGNLSHSETAKQTPTNSQRDLQADVKPYDKKHRHSSSSEGGKPSRKFPKVYIESADERDDDASVAAPIQDNQSVISHRSTNTLKTVESIASSEIISGSDASTIIESARKSNKNTIKNERKAYQRDLNSSSIKKHERYSHKVRQEALSRQVEKLTHTRGKERNGRNASNNPLEWWRLGNSGRAIHKVSHHYKTSARVVPKGQVNKNNNIAMLAFLKPFLDLPVFAPLERLLLAEASAIHYVSRKNTQQGSLVIERTLQGKKFIPSQAYEDPTKIAERLKDSHSHGILFTSRRPKNKS